jgi:thiamine-phosphate pyrophosphorylase
MTDEHRLSRPEAALDGLPRGTGVILRHYNDPARDQLAARLKALCQRHGLHLLVGGSWRLAAHVGAQGLHLPARMAAEDLAPGARLWLRRKKGLLTVAAHSSRDLRRASAIGATAALLSPIFFTESHPKRQPLGSIRCAAMTHTSKVAVIALGGITANTINTIFPTKCVGVAGISFASKK